MCFNSNIFIPKLDRTIHGVQIMRAFMRVPPRTLAHNENFNPKRNQILLVFSARIPNINKAYYKNLSRSIACRHMMVMLLYNN